MRNLFALSLAACASSEPEVADIVLVPGEAETIYTPGESTNFDPPEDPGYPEGELAEPREYVNQLSPEQCRLNYEGDLDFARDLQLAFSDERPSWSEETGYRIPVEMIEMPRGDFSLYACAMWAGPPDWEVAGWWDPTLMRISEGEHGEFYEMPRLVVETPYLPNPHESLLAIAVRFFVKKEEEEGFRRLGFGFYCTPDGDERVSCSD